MYVRLTSSVHKRQLEFCASLQHDVRTESPKIRRDGTTERSFLRQIWHDDSRRLRQLPYMQLIVMPNNWPCWVLAADQACYLTLAACRAAVNERRLSIVAGESACSGRSTSSKWVLAGIIFWMWNLFSSQHLQIGKPSCWATKPYWVLYWAQSIPTHHHQDDKYDNKSVFEIACF